MNQERMINHDSWVGKVLCIENFQRQKPPVRHYLNTGTDQRRKLKRWDRPRANSTEYSHTT